MKLLNLKTNNFWYSRFLLQIILCKMLKYLKFLSVITTIFAATIEVKNKYCQSFLKNGIYKSMRLDTSCALYVVEVGDEFCLTDLENDDSYIESTCKNING